MSDVSDARLTEIQAEALKRCAVSCDEYHAHSNRCLAGDADAVTICILVDEIRRVRRIAAEAFGKIGGDL